jgi:phosphoribosylaminoimidazole-succinocarboxamide synthase
MSIDTQILTAEIERTLSETDLRLPGLIRRQRGKVRDSYILQDGRRVIVTTDRLSAFDVVLTTIPFKGQVLNQLSAFWFREAQQVAENHLLAVPDPNAMLVRECQVLPVELIMRAYLTGVTTTSIWYAYSRGARTFCGHALPEGMKKNQALPRPILTPSTKAEHGAHDESVSGAELVRRGLIDEATLAKATAMCERLFALGQAHAARRGLILVDTKYEMGRLPDGRLVFVDEIHTPDSSRYWYAGDYEERLQRGEEPRSLDKEYVRRYLADLGYTGEGAPPPLPAEVRVEAARRYIAAYELITGVPFQPQPGPHGPRIQKNVAEALA